MYTKLIEMQTFRVTCESIPRLLWLRGKRVLPPSTPRSNIVVGLLCLTAMVFQPFSSPAQEPIMKPTAPQLAQYRIVIGQAAREGEKLAGTELAEFLGQSTGHVLPIVNDTEPATDCEIVLGDTTRLLRTDLPKELHPNTADGFAVYRDDNTLYVMGNTERGTLYGVYDLLEREVGCRFLTAEVTHVPQRDYSVTDVVSRKYDPPLEYRVIWGMRYSTPWNVRNRVDSVQMGPAIGQPRFIGPRPHHTFGYLVPAETYSETHPEYYALIKGKRRPTKGGKSGGLCLTQPDVLKIAITSIREWLDEYKRSSRYHPDSLQLVSVSVNDESDSMVCECADCQAVNEQDGAPSGTLIRFINAIAEELEDDYPNARIETLAYNRVNTPPSQARLHRNIIIRVAPIGSDFFRPFDDPTSQVNEPIQSYIKQWGELTNNLYVWSYHINFHAVFKPFPDFHTIDKNIRFLRSLGLRGYFAETSSSGGILHELRAYVLSKCMWRPETDSRQAVEEFCHLYYGKGAPYVLRFHDMVHEYVESTGLALHWNDASRSERIVYTYDFLKKLDDVLAAAETATATEDERQRVAEVRLSPWYLILEKAFSGNVPYEGSISLPLEWAFRIDPDNAGSTSEWHKETRFDHWQRIRTDDFWTRQGYDYHGTAWYAVAFDIAPDAAGKMDAIDFGAIDGEFHRVFLNGAQIDERTSNPGDTWNQPFRVKLAAPLPPGRHVLTVQVRKLSHAAGIWKPVTLINRSVQLPQRVRTAGERFIEVSTKAGVQRVAPGAGIEGYCTRIKAFLLAAEKQDGDATNAAAIRKSAALLPNPHNTYSIEFDESATDGSCLFQKADRNWTLGQAIRWPKIDEYIRNAEKHGHTLSLRVRVRAEHTGKDLNGLAFRFGYARQNVENWGATAVSESRVEMNDIPDKGWHWYELPAPLELQAQPARQYYAYVLPANNPDNLLGIYVDAFEIITKPAEN